MRKPKFITIVGSDAVERTIDTTRPWSPVSLDYIPFTGVAHPPSYMFTLGSGCLSLPTTSVYGISYAFGIDVFRHDFLGTAAPAVDVDHYVAAPFRDAYAIYKEPSSVDHHLRLDDERLSYMRPEWRCCVEDILRRNAPFITPSKR